MAGYVIAHTGLSIDARSVGNGSGNRTVVGTSDSNDDGLGRCAAVTVVDGHGDGIGDLLTFGQALHVLVGVVQVVGPVARAVHGEGAVAALAAVIHAPGVRVGGVDVADVELAGGGGSTVLDHSAVRVATENGGIVGADDGDSQCRSRAGTVFIDQGVGKGLDQGLTLSQCLHSLQTAIELIAIAAVGIEDDLAVQPLICANQSHTMFCDAAFTQLVVAQNIALQVRYGILEGHARVRTGLGNARRLGRRPLIGAFRQSAHPTEKRKHCSHWSRTSVFQRQRRHGLNDAGKTHKSAAAFATAGQGGRRGIQLIEWVPSCVDGRNDLVDLGARRTRYSSFFHCRRLNQVSGEMHILVLAHHQRWLTIRLQLHGAAGRRNDFGIGGDTHAFMEYRQIPIRTTHPSLASEFGNENGLSCHEGLPIQSD